MGGSAITTGNIPVTVYPATYKASVGTSGNDALTGSEVNDIIVADVAGLNKLLPAVGNEVRAAHERGGNIDVVVVVCGLNDWKRVELVPAGEEGAAQQEEDDDLQLQERTDAMAARCAAGVRS